MAKVTLTSADGFEFDAYHAEPTDARRGGLVVLHALWGVTPHIRELCDSYAADGYEVLAPSLFDRFERGFVDANVDPPPVYTQSEQIDQDPMTLPELKAPTEAPPIPDLPPVPTVNTATPVLNAPTA